MSLYNGIETDNVILNQDVSSGFYNRQKHFNQYLSSVASRIRNGQSILDSQYSEDQLVENYFQATGAELTRELTSAQIPTTGSWLLVKNSNTIGAITYRKVEDQVRFIVSADDSEINNTYGQIVDADNQQVVTTFTISEGQFKLTEVLDGDELTQFLAQIGSNCHKYYFSIVNDQGERVLSAGVCNPTRGIFVNDGSTATFDYTQTGTNSYPTRSGTVTQRVTLLEQLMGKLDTDWLTALNAGDVSGIGTLDSHIAALLDDSSSSTRTSLNGVFGGVLCESLATFMESHLTVLENLIIEIQAPTANTYIQYKDLITTSTDVASAVPTYTARISGGSSISFSTDTASAAQFAFIYNTNAQAWTIQVNNGSSWDFVKSDGSLAANPGPFTSNLDPIAVTGVSRTSSALTLGGGITNSEWFYRVATTIGSPSTAGGVGRYELRHYDLANQWLSYQSGDSSLSLGSSHQDLILTTTDPASRSVPTRARSLELSLVTANQPLATKVWSQNGRFIGLLSPDRHLTTSGTVSYRLAEGWAVGEQLYYNASTDSLTTQPTDQLVGIIVDQNKVYIDSEA